MWASSVNVIGQVAIVAGTVVAIGFSRRPDDEFIPADFAALREQTRRQRLMWLGVALAILGVAAQFAGGWGLSVWG